MAVLSDDMGGITAYAAAVNRGYTGTKEEFEQLMYSYTEVAERAEAAAGNAHESEEATIEAKDIAVSAKNEAVSARDASQSARDASVSAKNDSESARDSAISAKNDTLAAKDAVMSAKSDVDETSANFSEEVTAAISDVNAAGRNQKELAKTHAIDSEAWAVGQREGADVGVSDETYHNNSKYYAEQSALAKSETETARDTAITAKDNAVAAKNEAETAKGEAQDIVDGINAKSEQIDQNAEDISALQTAMETKAEIDGYYEDMTVGDAEQLVSSKYVEDSEPYLYRTSGGSTDIGNREYVDAIVGGTINWNQMLAGMGATRIDRGVTITVSADGKSASFAGTLSEMPLYNQFYLTNVSATYSGKTTIHRDGRKYLFYANQRLPYPFGMNGYGPLGGESRNNQYFIYSNNDGGDWTAFPIIVIPNDVELPTFDIKDLTINIFDITQMFGSTIADYIYQLEQATAGAGVAFFKALFPDDYYEYNAGELKSVEGVSAHEMIGFNQWDEEWDNGSINGSGDYILGPYVRTKNKIKVISGANYYFQRPAIVALLYFYDASNNFVSVSDAGYMRLGSGVKQFTVPNDCAYVAFLLDTTYGTTYNHDVCINLSWSGWRNGEYEPYVKHSYPLDSSLTLRGIPKLDANNNLYYDGDRYSSNGMVARNWWFETFDGSRTVYTVTTVGDYTRFIYKLAKTASTAGINGYPECLCSSLPYLLSFTNESEHYYCNQTDVIFFMLTSKVGSTSESVKNYLSTHPIQLLYRLATSIIEEAEPYAEIQVCDDFGTEKYVSTGIVPVGHETRYPANLRDKLQHLPGLADDDGYYMISQQNKNMSLELFRIPKAPTTDGVYTLKATVSGGTPTYTWEAEE